MRRMRNGEVTMTKEDIRVMAPETEVFVTTMEASDRTANVLITPPEPRPQFPAYQPYPQHGRPFAPQQALGGAPPKVQVCYNRYQPRHLKAACPQAAAPQGGAPCGGGRGGGGGGNQDVKGEGRGALGPGGQPTPRLAAPPRQAWGQPSGLPTTWRSNVYKLRQAKPRGVAMPHQTTEKLSSRSATSSRPAGAVNATIRRAPTLSLPLPQPSRGEHSGRITPFLATCLEEATAGQPRDKTCHLG